MKNKMKQLMIGISIIILFVGFVIYYLLFYGDKIIYTHTYYYVAKFVPVGEWEGFVSSAVFATMLMLYAIFPGLELSLAQKIKVKPLPKILMWLLAILVAVVVGGVILFTPMKNSFPEWFLYVPMLPIATLVIVLLLFASFPSHIAEIVGANKTNSVFRILAFIMAIVLVFMATSSLESSLANPPDKQILSPQASESTKIDDATHFIFFTLSPKVYEIKAGESMNIELEFKALDKSAVPLHNLSTQFGAYPIILDASHKYAVTVGIRSTGFNVIEPPAEFLVPRPIAMNKTLKWRYTISPLQNTEGTNQVINYDLYIYDLTEESLVAESPYTSVEMKIQTPLGLPKWLISPQIALGSIFAGLFGIVLPWLLNRMEKPKKKYAERK